MIDDDYLSDLYREGDPEFRRYHYGDMTRVLVRGETLEIFAALGAGKGNLKVLNSEPMPVLGRKIDENGVPGEGRTEGFRFLGSAWLQINAFGVGHFFGGVADKLAKQLQTQVFVSEDGDSGFAYSFYDRGKLVESYSRTYEDMYQYVPKHVRKKSDCVRADGCEVLQTKRKGVVFDTDDGAPRNLEASLYDEYDIEPLRVCWYLNDNLGEYVPSDPFKLNEFSELFLLDVGYD